VRTEAEGEVRVQLRHDRRDEAIDVHAHFGKCRGAKCEIINELTSGDAAVVVQRAALARTKLTMVSPLAAIMPALGGDPLAANAHTARVVDETDGLFQWVVVDPRRRETFDQAVDMLRSPKCAGVKIHPEQHGYFIAENGQAVFEFASEHGAIVQSHSGEQNSLPADFVHFADAFPEVPLIISHLGCGWDDDPTLQVRAIQANRHGNVFTDTSSAKSITSGLIEWAIREIGAEHIMYGTDSPLYFAPMQRARIDSAEISDRDKRLILCNNAVRLFGLPNQ